MHVVPVEARAGIFLKADHFALVAKLLGFTSDAALGRAFGMDPRTVSRAREGVIGERFIATVLHVFGEHKNELARYNVGVTFEDLFEVGDKAASA